MTYEEAFDVVVGIEGGYVNHPADRGGATKYGITQDTYNAWRRDPKRNLPVRDVKDLNTPEAREIYEEMYWNAASCDEWPAAVALMVFDASVNHGVHRGIKMLQGAVGSAQDGLVGPKTRSAVAATPPLIAVGRIARERLNLYSLLVKIDRSQMAFLLGWVNRIVAIWRRCEQEHRWS